MKSAHSAQSFLKSFSLLLPFFLSVAAVACLSVFVFRTYVLSSGAFRLLLNGASASATPPSISQTSPETFPTIPYESEWATLNVEGWTRRDIPVFFGDNHNVLRKGVGMWMNSRFCGQAGKTVLSAHVTSCFYELEDTEVGDVVTVDTVYGRYTYQVTQRVIFDYRDSSLLMPDGEEDTLLMYTCYPRENGYRFKSERLALICRKISGKVW